MATKIGNALRSLMERSGKLRSATSLKWLHSDRYLFLIGVGKDAFWALGVVFTSFSNFDTRF